jgi:hypothetical protein
MAQFNYTLPSGAEFTMQAPDGTTQDQADFTFYSQVAAGAFAPGGVVDRYLYPSGNPLQTGALADPGLWT